MLVTKNGTDTPISDMSCNACPESARPDTGGYSFADAGSFTTANAPDSLASALFTATLAATLLVAVGAWLDRDCHGGGPDHPVGLGPLLAGAVSDATGSLATELRLGPQLLLAAARVSRRQDAGAP